MKELTFGEFREQFEGAPYDDYELADIMTKIKDNDEAASVAQNLIDATNDFYAFLDSIEFERG